MDNRVPITSTRGAVVSAVFCICKGGPMGETLLAAAADLPCLAQLRTLLC